ncbi:MAG TPA: HAD family acid phosphatase [Candidatus Baltobacteraceae bacterium]|nr:HAD family acid phosphatase [Candidatus Baltobacteraceae bacterium]
MMRLLAATVLAAVYSLNGGVPNVQTVKQEIITYYDSGRHDADVARVDAHLQSYVDRRLKQHVREPAVVFDIDDTMLSTFAYEQAHDFGYDARSWSRWEHEDRFPPILPTRRLARELVREHVAIFYVTGRRQSQREVTIRELALAGYPKPAGYSFRPARDHADSVIPFKSAARAAIAARGFDILASIGDQWSDLRGGHAEHLYKLPNPMYLIP